MIEKLHIQENHQGFVFLYESKAHEASMRYPHRHTELEMNIVIRGRAEYILANQRYKLTTGSIVWLFPDQEHLLTTSDPNFKMYVIVFKESLIKNSILQKEKYHILTNPNPVGSFCRRVSLASIQKLERVCESICEINKNKEITSPAYYYAGQAFGFKENAEYLHADPVILNAGLSYLLTIGWHLFITEGAEEKNEALNPSLEKAIHLLKTFPEKDYSLTDLSMECGISTSRLSRLFNEQTGMSLVEYKNRLKLRLFIDCVKKNQAFNISEACYSVGFNSYSQFYKTFKQSFGVSPKAYFHEE